MITTKNVYGHIVVVTFEPEDTLESIASISRCTSNELITLMNCLREEQWAGEQVSWKRDEME